MGFFSWMTSDTERSIANRHSNRETFTVYMLSPDGSHLKEDSYDGYGLFGGVDAFVHWMKFNHPEECEGKDDDSIRNLAFDYYDKTDGMKTNCKYPLKFCESPCDYEKATASEICPDQGYFYSSNSESWYDCNDEENEDEY